MATNKNKSKIFLSRTSGLSLIEMMVALSIFSTLLYAGSLFMDLFNSQQRMSVEDEELISLRDELLTTMSCPDTIWGPDTGGSLLVKECRFNATVGNCNAKNYLAVKAAKPDIGLGAAPVIIESRSRVLPEGAYSKYKSLDVRASCTCCPECAAGKKIMVEYRRLKSGGNSTLWKDLFKGIPLRCVVMG
jgi:prepilin-type N-terminal cleavage/methylation domain-containing protein